MNQKNFEYLRDQVKFTGFGEGLENELKEKIRSRRRNSRLPHKRSLAMTMLHLLCISKNRTKSDMYFFNRYQVSPLNLKIRLIDGANILYQQRDNITLKEAYNLMNGRAVNKDLSNKEDQVYNAWIQMDFKQTDKNGNYKMKQYHQNYGYDLEAYCPNIPLRN